LKHGTSPVVEQEKRAWPKHPAFPYPTMREGATILRHEVYLNPVYVPRGLQAAIIRRFRAHRQGSERRGQDASTAWRRHDGNPQSHALMDMPRLFLHAFLANDAPTKLAQALKAVLDQTNSRK
jgi:hypothetical protein